MSALDDCLAQARKCCFKNSSTVEILEYYEGERRMEWIKGKDVHDYFNTSKTRVQTQSVANGHPAPSNSGSEKRCHLRLFFISATVGDDGLHIHVDPDVLKWLHDEGNLSAKFIMDLYQTEDWTVFPTSSMAIIKDRRTISSIQYGFWCWSERPTHSFVQLVVESDTITYYFVNVHDDVRNIIERSLLDNLRPSVPPLHLDLQILTHLLTLYRRGIGAQRTQLREIENHKNASTVRHQVQELHDLSRSWHAMLKDFSDLKEHTRQLGIFAGRLKSSFGDEIIRRSTFTNSIELLLQFESNCDFWSNWSRTYLERTNICINLAHQLENKEIALQARRESISMFTLAVMTAVFLPSTFVSSVLGSNFFNFDGHVFAVSGLWWTLPVASVPLTVAVLVAWYKWSQIRSHKT
ncbi:hypothetical protein F4777DRAFT_565078 [Nemania sp. FL0916]|nr:hypothetical protein F4777DRAFT_565078 [Nemania sp. FL0916]